MRVARLCLCVAVTAMLIGQDDAGTVMPASPVLLSQNAVAQEAVVGAWVADVGDRKLVLRLTVDGKFRLGEAQGTFELTANKLLLRTGRNETIYLYSLNKEQMSLSGADLPAAIVFSKQAQVGDYGDWLQALSPRVLSRRLTRIGAILLIVFAAWLIIRALHWVSYWVIFTDKGLLRYVCRTRKNRTRTIHSLVLNFVQYFVYFTALGYVLAELGVNYTAYLASLSVIGLAVGFGSQGLVQDVVTGFFIILEGQFDVGDMVEISGQIGVVEEIGLRMTRLRNYLGQTVVIPNRNIAVVGRFWKGAQQLRLDVATTAETAPRTSETLATVCREMSRHFQGIFLEEVEVRDPIVLETGEYYVRAAMSIWPGQQWVIDQQLIPRLREHFKANSLEIPGDRVVASYHTRGRRIVPKRGGGPA